MHITKSDLHQAPASQSSPREPHELVIVVRDEDLSAVRRLRDDIERVVEIHANGPRCVITENNITWQQFNAVALLLNADPDRDLWDIKSNVLAVDGPREYRAALHRGMVRVKLGRAVADVERNGLCFCINEHGKDGSVFIHHVNDTADLLTAVTRAAELLAARG